MCVFVKSNLNGEYLNMLPNYIVPTNHEIVQETYNNILKMKVLQLTTSAVSSAPTPYSSISTH